MEEKSPQAEGLVRAALKEDVAQAVEIERLSFPEPWSQDHFLMALEDLFLVFDQAGVQGFLVACVCKSLNRGIILKLAVHPEQRTRGIASALLGKALGTLGDMGLTEAELDVDVNRNAAIRLYEKFGFSVHTMMAVDAEDEDPFFIMKRALPACP